MGFSDEVHASRTLSAAQAKRAVSARHIPLPNARKEKSGLLPIVALSGAFSAALWWRKNSRKLQAPKLFLKLQSLLQGLASGGGSRSVSQLEAGATGEHGGCGCDSAGPGEGCCAHFSAFVNSLQEDT